MSEIYLGVSYAPLRRCLVLHEGYVPGNEAHDAVVDNLDGDLAIVKGVVPRSWQFVIEINDPQIDDYLNLRELFELWYNYDDLILIDTLGNQYNVIWDGKFDFHWISKSARYGALATRFLERLS
jgi:hypothetical protein